MAKKNENELVSNRKAFHDYEILETFEAGISLVGTEVKSLKNHEGNLQDAFVHIKGNEAYLKNCSISPYRFGSVFNHEERRDRKLLLHSYEIDKLRRAIDQKGMTIVPLSLYVKKGKIKIKIGVARGKKGYDKRQSIKEKEHKRAMDRAMKNLSK